MASDAGQSQYNQLYEVDFKDPYIYDADLTPLGEVRPHNQPSPDPPLRSPCQLHHAHELATTTTTTTTCCYYYYYYY